MVKMTVTVWSHYGKNDGDGAVTLWIIQCDHRQDNGCNGDSDDDGRRRVGEVKETMAP